MSHWNPLVLERYERLSIQERIAQTLHIAAWSNRPTGPLFEIIQKWAPGGVTFFQGTASAQAAITNELQAMSSTPLLISQDAEWGLGMRLSDSWPLPYAQALGAIDADELLFEAGAMAGRHLKRLGVHWNFAPVVDVNTNVQNPVIGFRSFGNDPSKVAQKAMAWWRGLRSEGIAGCAKHFPGHGDTQMDSHLGLPTINKDRAELEATEFYPFKVLIDAGIESVMSAHLQVPAIDPRPQRPASLSAPILRGVLRDSWAYSGIIVTDALDMKGVSDHFSPGETELEALLAGNDIMLFVNDVESAINAINGALNQGILREEMLREAVLRQLQFKYDLGLFGAFPLTVPLSGIVEEIHAQADEDLLYRLAEASVHWEGNPIQELEKAFLLSLRCQPTAAVLNEPLAHHTIESGGPGHFSYLEETLLNIPRIHACSVEEGMQLSEKEPLIILIQGLRMKAPGRFGIDDLLLEQLEKLKGRKNVMLVWMGNPLAMHHLPIEMRAMPCLIGYQNNIFTQKAAAKKLLALFSSIDHQRSPQ